MSTPEEPKPAIAPLAATPVPKKKRKSGFRRFLLILLAIPLLLILFLGAQFLIQRQSAWDFIPKQFQIYLQVPSISKVFDEWSKLDALHLVLRENPKLGGLEKTLLNLKASGLSDSPLFKALIDVQAHVVINRQSEAIVILDMGWRSALTRQLPLLGGMANMEGLTVLQKNGRSWFQYSWAKGSSAYILFYDNLALVAFKPETLETLLTLKSAGLSLSDMEKTRINEEFAKADSGSLRFLADPAALTSSFIAEGPLRTRIENALGWKDSALVSLDITNDSFAMQAATVLESKQEAVSKLLTHKNPVLNSLRTIPASTYLYTAMSLGDFRQLMQAWTLFTGQDLAPTLAAVDEGSKALLGLTIDELLWSWIGEEAGMLYLGNNGDPVIHLKIKDEAKRQQVFKKISDTILVDIDRGLVLDNVPITRIVIPDFIKSVLGIFGIAFDTPYFVVENDELFFSMNAENLALLINESRSGKLLYRTPEFEQLLASTPKNPALFLYYDLDKSVPFFLRESNLLSRVLKLYNRGALSVFVNDGYLNLSLNALRVDQRKTQPYPGFPLAIKGGIASAPWIGFLPGRNDPVVASIQNGNELILEALAGGEHIMDAPVEAGTQLIMPGWGNELLAWAPTGTFYRFGQNSQTIAPFPLLSPTQGSFLPVVFNDKILAFSRSEQVLLTISKDGAVTKLPPVFEAPILFPPSVHGNLAALAPKTFEGSVYLVDNAGAVQPGWPREGGGISLSGPSFLETAEGPRIAFLTQNGKLNLWKIDGSECSGFPLEMEAVFSAPPVAMHAEKQIVLALLDQSGTISLIKQDGTLLRSARVGGGSSEARLLCRDINADGNDELFIHGGKNTLDGIDANFDILPGFPVRGSFMPQFVDLNLDGKAELIAGSYDGNVYAYSIKK